MSTFENAVKLTPAEMTTTYLVRNLAPLVDVYVNDAFAAAHRAAPSMVAFQHLLPSAAGLQLAAELDGVVEADGLGDAVADSIGAARIDGVPGTAAPVPTRFRVAMATTPSISPMPRASRSYAAILPPRLRMPSLSTVLQPWMWMIRR